MYFARCQRVRGKLKTKIVETTAKMEFDALESKVIYSPDFIDIYSENIAIIKRLVRGIRQMPENHTTINFETLRRKPAITSHTPKRNALIALAATIRPLRAT